MQVSDEDHKSPGNDQQAHTSLKSEKVMESYRKEIKYKDRSELHRSISGKAAHDHERATTIHRLQITTPIGCMWPVASILIAPS